jgi:hypothetical protein
MAGDISERKAKLLAKQEKLKNQLNALEQREKQDNRKRDTRRKIVVGGAILAAIEKNDGLAAMVRTVLAAYVGRAQDRDVIADLLQPSAPASAPSPQPAAQQPEPPPSPAPSQPAQSSPPFMGSFTTPKEKPDFSTASILSNLSNALGGKTSD